MTRNLKFVFSMAARRTGARGLPGGFARWVLLGVFGAVLIAAAMLPAVQRSLAGDPLDRVSTDHYQILYPVGEYGAEKVRGFAEERERLWGRMAKRLEIAPAPGKIRLTLYPTYDQKNAGGGGRGEFNVDPGAASVAAVWSDAVPRVEPLPDALVLVRQAWGEPAHPFLGLAAAAYAADGWRGRPLSEWAPQITYEEGPYTLRFLAEADSGDGSDAPFLSPLVRRPLAGEFARWVISRRGLAAFRKLYTPAAVSLDANILATLGMSVDELESAWQRWLEGQARRYDPPPNPPRAALTFQRGVNFTQEGRRRGGGYASAQIAGTLADLRRLGVDSISLVPYAFMRRPDATQMIRFHGESDEGVSHAAFQARQLGIKVMLKPQIWLRGGLFPGDIRFDSESARRQWFASYRQWILHYARLAEENGSDLLCVGNELRYMSAHEAEWRELIATIRRIYRGPLTYGAHWGEEFESLAFWDALDYIGLNSYYPLATEGDTSAAALQEGAERIAQRVQKVERRWRRPVLLTEVGFPSQQGGVTQPWSERISRVTDTAEQARAYEAIFRAFYGKPWFYGMYWWKWYSTGSGGGPDDYRLTPMNKPAAEVMARWFSRPAPPASVDR